MSNKKFKAIVVDDDPIARKTVAFALEREGFSCAFACDGEKALERISAEQFDLVVTDLCMPNKNGHGLAVELLLRKEIPVIVVHSSVNDPRLTKDLMDRGVDDIIYKPANYAAFAAKMMSLVQRRQRARYLGGTTVPNGFDGLDSAAMETVVQNDMPCPIASIGQTEYERRLANVQHLFPLSTTAYDVYLLSNSDETTIEKLASVMLRDAALTTDVLRLANSAFYNRKDRPTIDLNEAIASIGFKKIGEVAIALNALGAFRKTFLPWLDADLGQARSLAASIALEHLCEACENRSTNKGMALCALLHPLARLVLGTAFQDEYKALIRTCHERKTALCDLELQVFPETHTAALSRVLSQWKVPVDIWGPLGHLAKSYESIAQLGEPLRSNVELIKLAVFIGEIAVGRWMPWDQIEPPPIQVLSRHKITNLRLLIERTRTNLGQGASKHEAFDCSAGFGQSPQIKGEGMHCAPYRALSRSNNEDWMPLLLATLGIQTISQAVDGVETSGRMLVNCINASAADVADASRDRDWENRKPLLLAIGHAPSDLEARGNTTRFPICAAALKASCEQFAN